MTMNIKPAKHRCRASTASIEITPSFQRFRLRAAIAPENDAKRDRKNEHAQHQQQRRPEARQNQM